METKKRKLGQGPPGEEKKLEIKDLSAQIPPVEGILNQINEAAKQEVQKPKPKQEGNCCVDLLRDCCMDD
jgi:hypothetical protein